MQREFEKHQWWAYYERFDYFSPAAIRDQCHPRIMEHPRKTRRSVVLVHGLTDSPFYLTAIGRFFFYRLGFNVYMPLLQGHGLKEPRDMKDVELEEWKANVSFAIDTAARHTEEVSIGGLSAGGALSFYMAARDPRITGNLYLFSAALDIAGGVRGYTGELKERFLRSFLAELMARQENGQPLIGINPYRYARMDTDGAIELGKLILENDIIMAEYGPDHLFPGPVFAAHSACDKRADIAGIRALQRITEPKNFTLFYIPESANVPHASVVLKDPIYPPGAPEGAEPLERPNPMFDEMMEALEAMTNIKQKRIPQSDQS